MRFDKQNELIELFDLRQLEPNTEWNKFKTSDFIVGEYAYFFDVIQNRILQKD